MKVTTTSAKAIIKVGTELIYTNGIYSETVVVTEINGNAYFTDDCQTHFFDDAEACLNDGWFITVEETEPVASSVVLQSISKEGETVTGICGATFNDDVYYCRFTFMGDKIIVQESMSKLPKQAKLLMEKVVKDNKERFTNETKMKIIELSETNCIEMTAGDFETKALQVASANLKKEITKVHKKNKKVGWKTEKGRALSLAEANLRKEFYELYGREALLNVMNKPSNSPYFKQSKSKGCGYGNM